MKNYIIVAAIALITGALGAKFFFPTIKEKIVEKEVEVIKKDVVTEIREVIKKDGTKEIVTVVTDRSQEKKETNKTVAIAKSEWHVSAAAIGLKDSYYQLQVERRVLGELHVGALATTEGKIGLTIGMSF